MANKFDLIWFIPLLLQHSLILLICCTYSDYSGPCSGVAALGHSKNFRLLQQLGGAAAPQSPPAIRLWTESTEINQAASRMVNNQIKSNQIKFIRRS